MRLCAGNSSLKEARGVVRLPQIRSPGRPNFFKPQWGHEPRAKPSRLGHLLSNSLPQRGQRKSLKRLTATIP